MKNQGDCILCGCFIFSEKSKCGCKCHTVINGMLEIREGDPMAVLEDICTIGPKIDQLSPEDRTRLGQIAMKAGYNADLTCLTDEEVRFLTSLSRSMNIRK